MQEAGLKPIAIVPSVKTKLFSAPESISCASIYASNTPVPDGEYPALVCIDNFNHMTCLSLPKLGNVYEEDIVCFEDVENRRCACIMASGDVILATNLSAVHRYTLPMVSLLGYQKQAPSAFQPGWGIVGGGSLATTSSNNKAVVEKAMKKKKKATRGSWWGGGHSKPADLSKIFGNAQLRMEQNAEMRRRELGLGDDDEEEGEGGEEKGNDKRSRVNKNLNETSNVMSENMNKLTERGEQIAEIQEKTSKMVLNAMLFEQQCKQIKAQQEDDCTIS